MKSGMRLYKRKDNGKWYVATDDGQRFSLKTRDASLARQTFRKMEREYLRGKVASICGECTVTIGRFRDEFIKWSEPVQPHSTFRANRLAIAKLIEQCGEGCLLDKISPKHVDQLVADHRRRGIKPASINNYIRHIKTCMNKAKEWEYVKVNPLKDVKEIRVHKSVPKFMPGNEISAFLATIKDYDLKALITAYISTGRRRSELLGLEWRDIDFKHRKYTIRHSKSQKDAKYTIYKMFLSVLQSLEHGEPHEKVFDRWSHPDTVSHMIKDALKAAGYGHLHLHSLRHSYASMLAADGRTLKEIQSMLGHLSMKATEIYTHFTEDHFDEIGEVNIGPVDLRRVK